MLNVFIDRSIDFVEKRSNALSRRSLAAGIKPPIPPLPAFGFLTMLANVVGISRGYPQGVHVAAVGQRPWLANVAGMERRKQNRVEFYMAGRRATLKEDATKVWGKVLRRVTEKIQSG